MLTPVAPANDSGVPFVYSIAAAVHRGDNTLRNALNASIERLQPRIDRILASYHVPILHPAKGSL
jgi:hypothetical protein